MTIVTARASVKARLDILSSDTTWDTQIDEFVQSAAKSLYPLAQREVAPQEKTVSVDGYGEAIVDLSTLTTPVLEARMVEAYAGAEWFPADDTSHFAGKLTVRQLSSNTTAIRIYGTTTFAIGASVGLTTVPEHLEKAVFWYAMSEFYDFLAGNKRKYNLYTNNGARAVDNMKDESEYYEQKANIFLNDRATVMGSQ